MSTTRRVEGLKRRPKRTSEETRTEIFGMLLVLASIIPILACKAWEWWHFNPSNGLVHLSRKYQKWLDGKIDPILIRRRERIAGTKFGKTDRALRTVPGDGREGVPLSKRKQKRWH